MSWSPIEKRKWKALISYVKTLFPRKRITIHRKPSSKFYGLVREKEGNNFLIIIDKDLPFDLAVYTLAEEVAHIKRGIKKKFETNHDERWGQFYAYFIVSFHKFLDEYNRKILEPT